MDFTLKVGNDNGNSEQDIYIENTLFKQPNVNAKITNFNTYDEENPIAVIDDIMDKILVGVQSGNITGTYLIGKSAVDSGERLNEMRVGFDYKSTSELPVVNTLGTLAAYSVQKYYKKKKDIPTKLEVGVEMTTALPVAEYYEDPINKARLRRNFLKGPHVVMVHLGNKRVQVELTFTCVVVLPEAAPVALTLLELQEGNKNFDILKDFNEKYFPDSPVDGSYFKDKIILHTDIGDGTTELPVTKDDEPLPNFALGESLGAGHVIEDALPNIRKAMKLPNMKRQEVTEIIRGRKLEKWRDKMMVLLNPSIEKQTDDIAFAVQSQVRKAGNDIDVHLVYGGGSILMKEALYPKLLDLSEEADYQILYVPAEYAPVMNAEGLNDYVNGEIFNYIKEDAIKKAKEKVLSK